MNKKIRLRSDKSTIKKKGLVLSNTPNMPMIEKAIWVVSKLLCWVAGIALTLVLVQTVTDVFLRMTVGAPIEGNLEIISSYHMILLTFLPLGLLELKHEHITVELFVQFLNKKLRRITEVTAYLVAAVFYAIMTYKLLEVAMKSYAKGEILMTSVIIELWPVKFILPLGFLLAMVTVLLHAWKSATDESFEPTPESPEIDVES